jgi:hypothetical protein
MHRRKRESAEKLEEEPDRCRLLPREDKELELEHGEGAENRDEAGRIRKMSGLAVPTQPNSDQLRNTFHICSCTRRSGQYSVSYYSNVRSWYSPKSACEVINFCVVSQGGSRQLISGEVRD